MGFKITSRGKLTEMTTGKKKEVTAKNGKSTSTWEDEKIDLTSVQAEKKDNEKEGK